MMLAIIDFGSNWRHWAVGTPRIATISNTGKHESIRAKYFLLIAYYYHLEDPQRFVFIACIAYKSPTLLRSIM